MNLRKYYTDVMAYELQQMLDSTTEDQWLIHRNKRNEARDKLKAYCERVIRNHQEVLKTLK